ncbi:hypothetical protein BpHYR1_020268 [Brachionus plicatilis]|uniref:Uncharacterized protein n=1 Tax=Brachionus plicatilis TaxID=10195 RepID=A0A3M7QJ55_BRAPC|nr:hypothetical protein BpHYR1_020268 [Brachionus plicatilis]
MGNLDGTKVLNFLHLTNYTSFYVKQIFSQSHDFFKTLIVLCFKRSSFIKKFTEFSYENN